MTTRRTALTMLGLAPATMVGSETFSKPVERPGSVQTVMSAYDKERYARAFENLARELRKDSVSIIKLELGATLTADSIADQHHLVLEFIYKPEVS